MVTQGGNAFSSSANDKELLDADLLVKWFLNEIKWFAIYSCILGGVMLIGTYFSIMLFNVAAHSQVSFLHISASQTHTFMCHVFIIRST